MTWFEVCTLHWHLPECTIPVNRHRPTLPHFKGPSVDSLFKHCWSYCLSSTAQTGYHPTFSCTTDSLMWPFIRLYHSLAAQKMLCVPMDEREE